MHDPSVRRVTLYMRPGCHLCEDAAELLEWIAASMPIEVVEVNILEDVGLFERYRYSIPVVTVAGGPTLTAPIRAADLLRLLAD